MSKLLKFEGHNYLRQRLILATLSGKIVRIDKIRSDDEDPGIRGMNGRLGNNGILTTRYRLRKQVFATSRKGDEWINHGN